MAETKTIQTRTLNPMAIESIENHEPYELYEKCKNGDYLYMYGICFVMVFYSLASLPNGQSHRVTFWSELYDIEINLDFAGKTTTVEQPLTDWRKMGF